MYLTTGYLRVVALDAATGKELWQFDPLKDHPFEHQPASGGVNRGCAFWSDGKPGGERRIIHGTSDGRLFSLDAEDRQARPEVRRGGNPQPPQGARPEGGPPLLRPDVRAGRLEGHDHRRGSRATRGRASPRRGTSGRSTSAPGRRSGDSTPSPGPASSATRPGRATPGRTAGARTPGAGSSVDADRGLVFAGLGSAAFDFYGGDRHGDNLFANCTIALDASDGQASLALPDVASRPLGSRPAGLSQPRHRHPRRQDGRRRGPGDEDGLRLPVRSGHGQAPLRDQGPARARPPTSPASRPRRLSPSRSSRRRSPRSSSTSRT